MEPGVQKGKRSLLACHTHFKYFVKTTRKGKIECQGHTLGEKSNKHLVVFYFT